MLKMLRAALCGIGLHKVTRWHQVPRVASVSVYRTEFRATCKCCGAELSQTVG